MKLQGALEYLLTYSWAILIIVIALGVLVFYIVYARNSYVKIQPGSCVVNRPFGPNSTQYVRLVGTCTDGLPEFVAHFSGNGPSQGAGVANCNGPDFCITANVPFARPQCNFTLSAWAYDTGMGSAGTSSPTWEAGLGAWEATSGEPSVDSLGGVVYLLNVTSPSGDAAAGIEYNDTLMRWEARSTNTPNQYFIPALFRNEWVMTTLSVSDGIATAYLNGSLVSPPSNIVSCGTYDQLVVGTWDRPFAGYISNVQVYNISLSGNTIYALYQEGLGGVPIEIQNVVVWWPLNGNPTDYSGTYTNGAQNAMAYTNLYPSYGAP